jgi:2-hydroxy-6-oxonona-2,4-dienedioate hydrolase
MQFDIISEERFKYAEKGKGEVLVLLHGLFGNLANFQHVVAYFSDKYRVVVPFLPLYELPIRETTVDGLVQYVHEFIAHKGYEQIHLLGNSLGGHVALVYALQHPEKVSSLILTGSSGLFERAFGETMPKRGDYEYIKHKTQQTFYNPAIATKELIDEVFDIVNDREKALRILSLAKSAVRHNMSEEVKAITTPTYLIWGRNDNITPPFVAEEFHKLIPNSTLAWIEECGHAAMMEQPDAFNKLLERFLRSVKQTVTVDR